MNAVMKQEPERQINWFDLSRFGVALRVLPNSPLRGSALTVLEIRDGKTYQAALGWLEGMSDSERRALREGLNEVLRSLGFGDQPAYVPDPDKAGYRWLRFYSARQSLSLREIKRLVPGAEVTDLRAMPVNEVAIREAADPEVGAYWKRFLDTTLKHEAKGVWVLKQNPYEKPWAEAGRIEDHRPRGEALNRKFSRVESGSLADKLDKAGYRDNALVGFYATRAAALADGHAGADIEQVDLPYAAPLWVTRGGQVVAVKDVRYSPEIMGEAPSLLYGEPKGGLVVSALRDIEALKPWLEARVATWIEQHADEARRPGTGALWDSINEAVVKIAEVSYAHSKLYGVSSLLAKAGIGEVAPPYEAKTLDRMDGLYARQLAVEISLLTGQSAETEMALDAALIGLIEHAKGLLAEETIQRARQSLQQVAEHVGSADPSVDTDAIEPARIEDVGEKIGGARKDFAKRALVVDDLEVMNTAEREALVTKANVWPPLNYEAMRESGVTAQAAMAIKTLKDMLATAPDRQHSGDVDALYIQAIGLARDHMAEVKTLADFNTAMAALYDAGLGEPNRPGRWGVYGAPLQFQWGRRASTFICEGGANRWGDGNSLPGAVTKAIRKYVGSVADEAEGKGSWGYLIRGGKMLTPEEKAQRDIKAKQNEELHRPHLDKVVREGQDWRRGRDIVAEDLLETFGFRGLEFGNWLPQDERQDVINMAFDSFMDLSQALDLPPKALSFDGKLALAFGARGNGGRGAALAHFEGMREVINLTRMKGAGALAHEWFHGLDWHMGDGKHFASDMQAHRVGSLGVAMVPMVPGMLRRGMTMEELDARTSTNIDQTMSNVAGWSASPKAPREAMANLVKIETDALREKFYDIAYKRIELLKAEPGGAEKGLNPGVGGQGAIALSTVQEQIDDMMDRLKDRHPERKMFTKYTKQIRGNVAYLVTNMAASATIDALRDLNVPMPQDFSNANAQETQYLKDARKLDEQRNEPYWATRRELFARAGAAYVSDRLDALGVRSDYLVYGADEERHLHNELGNPNPAGVDRQRLNLLFNDLIAAYRVRVVSEAAKGADALEP